MVLLGPHMFSVHSPCKKKLCSWDIDSWTLGIHWGKLLIFCALLQRAWYKCQIIGGKHLSSFWCKVWIGTALWSRKRKRRHWSTSVFILFSNSLNSHTQLIICTGTSMADSGLCFFAWKRDLVRQKIKRWKDLVRQKIKRWQTKRSWDVEQITLLSLSSIFLQYREWISKYFPVGREGLTVLKSILPCWWWENAQHYIIKIWKSSWGASILVHQHYNGAKKPSSVVKWQYKFLRIST